MEPAWHPRMSHSLLLLPLSIFGARQRKDRDAHVPVCIYSPNSLGGTRLADPFPDSFCSLCSWPPLLPASPATSEPEPPPCLLHSCDPRAVVLGHTASASLGHCSPLAVRGGTWFWSPQLLFAASVRLCWLRQHVVQETISSWYFNAIGIFSFVCCL